MWSRSSKQRKAAERRRIEREARRRNTEANLRLWRGYSYVESDGPKPTAALIQLMFNRALEQLIDGERVLQ